MKGRVALLAVTLFVLLLLVSSSARLGTRPTDFHFFQLESKLIYIILTSLTLGALVMFLLVSFSPARIHKQVSGKPAELPPSERISRAGAAYQLGDWENAEALLRDITPTDAGYWFAEKVRGDIALQKEDRAGAEAHYQDSLKSATNEERALPLLGLASLYDRLQMIDRARDLYQEVIRVQPQSQEAAFWLRLHAVREQDWALALSWQEYLEQRFPRALSAPEEMQLKIGIRFELAHVQFLEEAYKTAQALLKFILRMTDSFTPAYLLLGEIHMRLQNPSSALKTWENGFQATMSPVLLKRIGEYFLSQNLPETAIEYFRNTMRNQPENCLLQFCFADLYLKMEMLEEARKVLENIEQKDPGWLLNRLTLGELYKRSGQFEKAALTFHKALSTGEAVSILQWKCYSCNTTYHNYHGFCLECLSWNCIDLNQNKAVNMDYRYGTTTASPS